MIARALRGADVVARSLVRAGTRHVFALSGNHIMPMAKFARVAEAVRAIPGITVSAPEPARAEDITRVHTHAYIDAIRTGEPRALAESQKFPWSPELHPSVMLTNGGVIAAASAALEDQVGAAIASGFHHAHADHGEGFCTFNGLIVAAAKLRAERRVDRVAILDLDLHYGNGTASLAASRAWIRALSIYGNDYQNNQPFRDVTERHHQDGSNHRSVPLPARCDRARLLGLLEESLPWLIEGHTPDLLLFQAGADPFREDPYSPLDLGIEDLLERDRRVFRFAHHHRIPIAWVLAGGYTPDLQQVVNIHVNTFMAAKEIYAP